MSEEMSEGTIPEKPTVVVCGDIFEIPKEKDLTIGPGLVYKNESIVCTKPGVIRSNDKSVWVDRNNRRFDISFLFISFGILRIICPFCRILRENRGQVEPCFLSKFA